MKIKNLSTMRKLMLLLLSVFSYAGAVTAQSVSMSINNCAVTAPNEIQFDVTATNLTAANILHWNSVVIRLTYSTGFLASTSDAVVWGYVGNSDFPLSLPPAANPTFTSNPAGATKLQLQTGAGIYNNATCTAPAIAAGATAKIGRFFLRDNTAPFVAGQVVGLTWITSSGLVLYLDCATTVTNYNTAGTRTLNSPCSLTIPAGCTSPTLNSSPSDQSICTSGTATFTGSFNGGSPVPTLIWQVQAGGTGPFTDLTETAPYSGTATGTLTITNPNISLSTNRYRLRANNTCGDVFANTTGALLTVSTPPNAGAVSGSSPVCINNTATYSSNGDAGGTWSSTNTGVATVNASSGVVTTLSSGTSDITYTVGSSCTTSAFKTISVSSFTTLAGVAGGAEVCKSANVLAGGSSFSDASCSLIAKVVPSGGSPVSGNINTCVKIDDIVRTYQSTPYVQRIYNIEPATNAATATSTVTLYYTQAEFDAYNLARGTFLSLPTGPGDLAGIFNIRITQFHGTGTYPGNYTGSSLLINPVDANIIYNASGSGRWEVTFDIIGFSGFYLSTSTTPLPITLLNFSGKNNGHYNVLDWTTSSEQNSSYFDLLRSTDGINFVKVSTINAAGNSSISKNYNYNDDVISINNNIYYYKLKMVDVTGSIKYSATVKIKLNSKGFNVEATPNPFTDQIKINIETPLSEKAIVSLKDISGRKLRQTESSLRQGNNALQLTSLGNIPSGVYLLTITTDTEQQTIKIIKQ